MNHEANPVVAAIVSVAAEPLPEDELCYVMSEDIWNELKAAVMALRAVAFLFGESSRDFSLTSTELSGLFCVLHSDFEHVLDNLKPAKAV